jgi:hypothetical protein
MLCFFKCGITSIPALHKEFAEALFKCDRWDDCLVVCEKILNQETGKDIYKMEGPLKRDQHGGDPTFIVPFI